MCFRPLSFGCDRCSSLLGRLLLLFIRGFAAQKRSVEAVSAFLNIYIPAAARWNMQHCLLNILLDVVFVLHNVCTFGAGTRAAIIVAFSSP